MNVHVANSGEKKYRASTIIPSQQIYKRQQLFWPTSQKVIDSPKLMNKNTFIPERSAIMASKKARPLTSKPVMEVTISKRKLEKWCGETKVCLWNYSFIFSCLRWDSKCKPSHLPAAFSWPAPLMVKSIESGCVPVLMLQQKHDGPIFVHSYLNSDLVLLL